MPEPPDPLLHPEQIAGAPRPRRVWLQWTMYILAVALLAGCVWMGYGEFSAGWDKVRQASSADIALMLGAVVANIVLDGFVFWVVLVPFRPARPVMVREMIALIGATSLLNYLPMRAGMIGRAAYLKQRHGVGYGASVIMLLAVASATMGMYVLLGGLALALGNVGLAWCLGVVVGLFAMAWGGIELLRHSQRWMPRFVLKYMDESRAALRWLDEHRRAAVLGAWMVMVVRTIAFGSRAVLIWAAARVYGTPITGQSALLLAICGTFITLATPLPNGMGVREGVYGLLAKAGIAGDALTGQTGINLGLIERAIEAVVFIALGAVSLVYLHQRTRVRKA